MICMYDTCFVLCQICIVAHLFIFLGLGQKKSMFAVACPKTVRYFSLFFYFIDKKTAMHNLLINRTERNTHKNNTIGRGPTIFVIYYASKSETVSKF